MLFRSVSAMAISLRPQPASAGSATRQSRGSPACRGDWTSFGSMRAFMVGPFVKGDLAHAGKAFARPPWAKATDQRAPFWKVRAWRAKTGNRDPLQRSSNADIVSLSPTGGEA